jgi:MFS family permease
MFLFLFNPKLEKSYCFSKLNQFDSCTTEQICKNYNNKISIILYNDSLDIHNNSLTNHQNFIEEFKSVNKYYRPFFVNHNFEISKKRLFYSLNLVNYNADKLNIAIILTKKENWNIFLKFFSLCQREYFYFYSVFIVIIAGIIGSFISGVLADIFGRKKIIIFNLFIVALSFTFFSIITLFTQSKYQYYLDEYKNKYNVTSFGGNDAILSLLYSQQKTSQYFESNAIKYFIPLFLLCLTLRALGKVSLALLLEDSTNELKVLENFRRYTFFTTGLPPLVTFFILLLINNFTITILLVNFIFIILFILSFCLLNESIRFKYEHSEWKELTEIIENLFTIENEASVIYKNKIEFEAFKLKEFQIMLKKMYVNLNFKGGSTNISIYNYIKKRTVSLNRDIRRNYEVIIKNQEMRVNPFIIFTCISANRVFLKVKYLFVILLSD